MKTKLLAITIFLSCTVSATSYAEDSNGIIKIKTESVKLNSDYCKDSIFDLEPGKYVIEAKKENHIDAQKEIFINIGRSQEINLMPEPIMAVLNVISDPKETAGAKIFLDGEEKGVTPSVFPFIIGEHMLKLTLDGYVDSYEEFSLSEGENKKLRINMQTYKGSQNSKRDFWKRQKWYSLGAFIASVGAGSYFYVSGNGYYDDYESSSSTLEAQDFYDKSISADKYRNVSFSVSLAPLGYFFWSWYKQDSYE